MDMYSVIITLAILRVCSIVGVKLHGPCGKALPTHDVELLTNLYPKILYRVPFSAEKPSYLFREPDLTMNNTFYETTNHIRKKVGTFTMVERGISGKPKAHVMYSTFKKDNNSIVLNTTVRYQDTRSPMLCFLPIVEEVRVYFDNGYALLWSCLDSVDGIRDEAVIVFTNVDTLYANPNISRKLNNISVFSIAPKYVSQDVVQILVKDSEVDARNLWKSTKEEQFVCPFEGNKLVVLISIVSLVLGLLGALLWYMKA